MGRSGAFGKLVDAQTWRRLPRSVRWKEEGLCSPRQAL